MLQCKDGRTARCPTHAAMHSLYMDCRAGRAATAACLCSLCPSPPHTATHPQVMGPPSQAQRLAALPDLVEFAAWMLHLQVMVHSAPEAYAQARGVAVEVALQQDAFCWQESRRHCDMISVALSRLTTPLCAPDELLHGGGGALHSDQLLGTNNRACGTCTV